MEEPAVKQCCAAFYSSDVARFLLGDSFHPGGTALTSRLGTLLDLSPDSQVLDVASGRGTSAFYLAETFGCCVTGLDFSGENVSLSQAAAAEREIADRLKFQTGDAEDLPYGDDSFDAIVCECAFCTFPGKPAAAREFFRVLKPGGWLGISDLTRSMESLPELDGLLAWIACIGDALPAERYKTILSDSGFRLESDEDHSQALLELVQQVQSRLMGAEILSGLKKIEIPGVDFSKAREFARAALNAVRSGKLGYRIITGRKPVSEGHA
jgi:arsenite methyltransferase